MNLLRKYGAWALIALILAGCLFAAVDNGGLIHG